MKDYQVIDLGDRLPRSKNPYALLFVISPKGNFLIKGSSDACQGYVDEHFPVCIYRYTYWQKKSEFQAYMKEFFKIDVPLSLSRGSWRSKGIEVFEVNFRRRLSKYSQENSEYMPVPPNRNVNFLITSRRIFEDRNTSHLWYRRLPKKWIPEWNELVIKEETKAEKHARMRQELLEKWG